MTFSISLDNRPEPLILDTSVLVNLHASSRGAQILAALPNSVVVPELVAADLEHETSKIRGEHRFIQALETDGILKVSPMTNKEYILYESLVTGEGSLGDGEAATIAMAAIRSHIAVVDERRGRTQAGRLMPKENIAWSIDLIANPVVANTLGREAHIEAVYLALRNGRMRVHEDHCDQVVALIGVHRALTCNSLPGYRYRQQVWKKAAAEAAHD